VWQHDNPFPGGADGAIPGGTYDASSDVVGVGIEIEK